MTLFKNPTKVQTKLELFLSPGCALVWRRLKKQQTTEASKKCRMKCNKNVLIWTTCTQKIIIRLIYNNFLLSGLSFLVYFTIGWPNGDVNVDTRDSKSTKTRKFVIFRENHRFFDLTFIEVLTDASHLIISVRCIRAVLCTFQIYNKVNFFPTFWHPTWPLKCSLEGQVVVVTWFFEVQVYSDTYQILV